MKDYFTKDEPPLTFDVKNESSETPLMIACKFGSTESLRVMLEMEDSKNIINAVDLRGRTALRHGCERNHHHLVKMLLEKGTDKRVAAYTGPT